MAEVAVRSAKKQKSVTGKKKPVSSKAKPFLSQSVDSPAAQVLHLQRTIGNRAVTRLIQSGAIQAKITGGKPNDIYEKEAHRMAEGVKSMPERSCAQRESIYPESGNTPKVTSNTEANINTMKGGGQPLSESSRAFFEPRFGADFSRVRIHTDSRAANTAQTINAKAFTISNNIVFNSAQYSPETTSGKRLLAHELTHVVQQGVGTSRTMINRIVKETKKIARLRKLLDDDQESEAIDLMKTLNRDKGGEVEKVLASREFKELAISAFNNKEMYRGILAMRGDLYPSLVWMFDEGTDWGKVRQVIIKAPSGKDRVRSDNWMKKQFVKICNDKEMTEAVDLLGGTLLRKLSWMYAEGVGDWNKIKAKISAKGVPKAEKIQVLENNHMKKYFVKELNDKEMTEAVDLLGATLLWKLSWMYAEGVGDWNKIKAKIPPKGKKENEKRQVRENNHIKKYFVKELNDKEMAEAVDLLGGTLLWKLSWMYAGGSNWELVKKTIQSVPDRKERSAVTRNSHMKPFFVSICSNKEMWEAVNLLGVNAHSLSWMEKEGIFEDCSLARERQIFDAHRMALTMLRNAITRLSVSPLATGTKNELTRYFNSNSESVARSIKSVLQKIRRNLPSASYECESSSKGMCKGADAYVYWIFGDIHLCPPFFLQGTRDQSTDIIHEAAHRYTGKTDLSYIRGTTVSRSTFKSLISADPYSELVKRIG